MMESEAFGIHSLPDEIIVLIMKSLTHSDCNSFMRTCKRYNDVLKSSHSLWRVIYKKTAGKIMYNITAAHSEGNWMSDLRQYLTLREFLIGLIAAMSKKHFSEIAGDCGLYNVKHIFNTALCSNTNYYCTISIIQNHIREANKRINTYETKSPYTLTEVYYGQMVLRYLYHVVLALKWGQNEAANLLTPVIVLNFFIQWIDPLNMHSDEEVQDLIKGMIYDVDRALLLAKNGVPLHNVETNRTGVNGIYSEKEVLLAISYYMYKQRRMVQIHGFNEDTLDVVRTIKSNSGHAICLGAIFEAIARGFGITSCNLVAFFNHAYVEWAYNNGFDSKMMKFRLDTGDLSPMGHCPYSGPTDPISGRGPDFADKFACFIAKSYVQTMGAYRNWRTIDASHFLHLIMNSRIIEYYNFILYVRGLDHNKLAIPFNMEYIHEEHINCIRALLVLNKTPTPKNFNTAVHHRSSEVMYCVGLICFNKVHDYVCVIRHWDTEVEPDNPRRCNQPHYKVIAMDQSERYISQDDLSVVSSPSRIYHLEEFLGKEFSHFNGFFYVPNKEKQMLFPDDISVGNAFASQRKFLQVIVFSPLQMVVLVSSFVIVYSLPFIDILMRGIARALFDVPSTRRHYRQSDASSLCGADQWTHLYGKPYKEY